MDPVTGQLIIMGLSLGSQAIQAYAANKGKMTPEQQAEADGYIARITAAQNSVTPYVKEPQSA